MTPTYFAAIVLAAALWASGTRMIAVFLVCCLFGGSAALSLDAIGGAPVNPGAFALLFLLVHAWRLVGLRQIGANMVDPAGGLWLSLLILWCVFGAIFVPRLFRDEVLVITADRTAVNSGLALLPLAPSTGNLTQAGYAIGGLLAFAAMRTMLEQDEDLRMFKRGLLALAVLNIAFAVINLAEQYSGLSGFMDLIRNGNYATMDGGEVGGLVRISGTFPESSSFSTFTLPLFAATFSLWRGGQNRRLSGMLALVSLTLLLISTSTTAYASLLVYFSILAIGAAWKVLARGEQAALGASSLIIWGLLIALCCVVLLNPSLLDAVSDFFQITLLRKLQSSSGIERSSWNEQAWTNFIETFGVGVGIGSARASSFPLVVLSNLGAVGALLFSIFVARVLHGSLASSSGADDGQSVARAAGHGLIACLIAASVSGTVFDLGMAFYAYAGAASAMHTRRRLGAFRETQLLEEMVDMRRRHA